MFALLIKKDGIWLYRCNDGRWRNEPWFGTMGWCMKVYKSEATAKGAFSKICLNSTLTPSVQHWITNCEGEGCSTFWHRVREEKEKEV